MFPELVRERRTDPGDALKSLEGSEGAAGIAVLHNPPSERRTDARQRVDLFDRRPVEVNRCFRV